MEKDHEVEVKKSMLLDEAVEELIKIYDPLNNASQALAELAALEDKPSRAALYVNYTVKFTEQRLITDKIAQLLNDISYMINTATDREEE